MNLSVLCSQDDLRFETEFEDFLNSFFHFCFLFITQEFCCYQIKNNNLNIDFEDSVCIHLAILQWEQKNHLLGT